MTPIEIRINGEHYTAEVLQFLMPNGMRKLTSTELPIETKAAYEDMLQSGCRFEAEVLRSGQVSITISDPVKEEDVDISLTGNGPEVQRGMVEMLQRKLWQSRPPLTANAKASA